MDLKIPDFTKDIDFESTPLKNIEKASTETAVQAKRIAELAERRAQKAEQDAKDADSLTPFFPQSVHLQPLPSF